MARTYATDENPGPLLVEVQADASGEWAGNALRFDDVDEAKRYGQDLWSRWTAVREWRVRDTRDDTILHTTQKPEGTL
jgi:hypothetical protein